MPTPACAGWPGIRLTSRKPAKRSAALFAMEIEPTKSLTGFTLWPRRRRRKSWLDLNETIGEVIAMARSEVRRNHVSLQTKLANDLPLILGIESNCNK